MHFVMVTQSSGRFYGPPGIGKSLLFETETQ